MGTIGTILTSSAAPFRLLFSRQMHLIVITEKPTYWSKLNIGTDSVAEVKMGLP